MRVIAEFHRVRSETKQCCLHEQSARPTMSKLTAQNTVGLRQRDPCRKRWFASIHERGLGPHVVCVAACAAKRRIEQGRIQETGAGWPTAPIVRLQPAAMHQALVERLQLMNDAVIASTQALRTEAQMRARDPLPLWRRQRRRVAQSTSRGLRG